MIENQFFQKEKTLKDKLKKIHKRKLELLWPLFVMIFAPFGAPFLPMRRSNGLNFGETLGYWNTVLIFGVALGVLIPILVYQHFSQIKKDEFDIKRDLEILYKEKK